VPIKQLNAFVVRDSEENLKLIESLLSRLDKQQSKFVIDVNLYEVNAQLTTQIGDLSGTISSKDLSLLQNNTSSRLIGSTKLHAFENQPVAFTMGKRVPISLTKTKKVSNTPSTSSVEHSKQSEQTSEQNDNTKSSSAYEEQLQYVDIGLNMELSPVIYEDSVQMNTNIELTGATNATPNVELNHHRVREMISIKNDQTKLVTNTFPISSNFFVSTQNNSPANLVITITPHIISSPEITPLDKTPIGSNGTATHFDTSISLEEMVIRADQDEAHSK
jgi:type II secretory pathway component GspD/PulD (secretin)